MLDPIQHHSLATNVMLDPIQHHSLSKNIVLDPIQHHSLAKNVMLDPIQHHPLPQKCDVRLHSFALDYIQLRSSALNCSELH
jgi:hypothetical protein